MAAYKAGVVKWFRGDGTGYLIDEEFPEESIFVDQSVLHVSKNKKATLKKGQRVKFKSKLILGRKVATDVQPL